MRRYLVPLLGFLLAVGLVQERLSAGPVAPPALHAAR